LEFESSNEERKVNDATEALVVMHSIDQSLNPQVPINRVILNFPPTPDAVSEMTGTPSFHASLFSGSPN
jgi:hypothetical protein